MSGKKRVLCMSWLVRHAHVGRFRLRWRSGVHPEERWHHCQGVSHRVTCSTCCCNTVKQKPSAFRISYDKTDRPQQSACLSYQRSTLSWPWAAEKLTLLHTTSLSLSTPVAYVSTHKRKATELTLSACFLTWTHQSVWAALMGLKGPHCQAERFNNIDKHRSRSINLVGKYLLSSSVVL